MSDETEPVDDPAQWPRPVPGKVCETCGTPLLMRQDRTIFCPSCSKYRELK